MRSGGLALVAAVVAAGAGLLWWGTEGLSVFTAETARREAVALAPRVLPDITLQDEAGATITLDALRGKVVLADFIYTRCPTICTVQGSDFEQARAAIRAAGLGDDIALVSISFDPEHDGPEELAFYASRFGGADDIWHFARAPSRADTGALLRAAEVIVLPDGIGGFIHNSAIHVIDPQGRLVRILDDDAWREALVLAQALADDTAAAAPVAGGAGT
ncbi:MAG: SCO family protein [Rubellimicrobium sp.]|nr:SCO family protein [Rubellimicrobium sp.]